MQKFKRKLKNTPRNASQVPCSVNSQLNKDQSPSVEDGLKNNKRTLNNPNVNLLQHKGGKILSYNVYVISKKGNPLMPCKPANARHLLKKRKAKVIKRFPFTIQLLEDLKQERTQEITLGIDTGFGNIGFSAITKKKELISGVLKLDGKTKERLEERRMYRRGRRNKLWYREPRFNNRKRKECWLPPSIERRYQTHLSLIQRIKKLLPISQVILEIAKFDIQKMENPEISEKEYQQGDLYQYQSIRSYLISREKGLCEHCKKDFKNNPSHIHHRKPKSKEGSGRLENLMLLHEKCHKLIHKKENLLKKYSKASTKTYKESTFMSIINKRFWKDIKDLQVTYGNMTFINRNKLGLEKSHTNDAFVIAKGKSQERIKPLEIIQKHRNNRVLQVNRKGYKPSIRKQRYKIQPLDLFWVNNKQYSCKGMFSYGKSILYGNTKKKEYFNIKYINSYFNQSSFVFQNIIIPTLIC